MHDTGTRADGGAVEAVAALEADLHSPIESVGSVRLGRKSTTGRLSAPKHVLAAEGIEVSESATDRPDVPVFYHKQRGLLIYDLRGDTRR